MTIDSQLDASKPVPEAAKLNSTDLLPNKDNARDYRNTFNSSDAQSSEKFLPNFKIVDNGENQFVQRSVGTTGDGKPYRVYRSGSDFAVLKYKDGWYYGKDDRTDTTPIAPVKVHVGVTDAADLRRVQSVLIPALQNDPVLQNAAVTWKTMDPHIGIDGTGIGPQPSGMEQGAKGFTIYSRSTEDAAIVQKRIDEILEQNGLSLPAPIASGNVDRVYGNSNRVGMTRDHWFSAVSEKGNNGALLDKEVEDSIKTKLGADPTKRLNDDQLRQAESNAKIRPNSLEYTAEGKLVYVHPKVIGPPGSEPEKELVGKLEPEGSYVSEVKNSKIDGDKTGRVAVYALYDSLGLDPNTSAVNNEKASRVDINGVSLNVDSEGFDVRRALSDQAKDDVGSGAHIYRGGDGKLYINDKSTLGTWINGVRIPPNQPVPFTVDDNIVLGGANGSSLFSKLPDDVEFRRPIGSAIKDPVPKRIGTGVIADPIARPIGPGVIADPIVRPIGPGVIADPIVRPIGPGVIADPFVRPIGTGIIASGNPSPIFAPPKLTLPSR